MQASSLEQFVGQTLGNYHVERLLGQGRLNAVYLARNLRSQDLGALTLFMMPASFSQDARYRFIERFRKEATILAALRHPHLLPVHEYGEFQGYPYLVTPYMMNGSLADVLKREGPCDHETALEILEQIGAGLEYAHSKGVIHGTLKPANLVLTSQETILVAGFGLMHILQKRGIEPTNHPYGHLLSIADTFLAAPEYLAPEIVQGQSIDARSDIYALGIILFELLSGKLPFTGTNPLEVAKLHVQAPLPSLRALRPQLPIALESVINQALDRDPSRRFKHVREFVEAFAQVSRSVSRKSSRKSETRTYSLSGIEGLQDMPATGYMSGGWQLMPPIVTGKMAKLPAAEHASGKVAAVQPPSTQPTPTQAQVTQAVPEKTESWQLSSSLPPTVQASSQPQWSLSSEASAPVVASAKPPTTRPNPMPTLVPAVPAVNESVTQQLQYPAVQGNGPVQSQLHLPNPEAFGRVSEPLAVADPLNWGGESFPVRSTTLKRGRVTKKRSRGVGRRKAIALLATGGLVAAGAFVTINMSLAHMTNGADTPTTQNTQPAPPVAKQPAQGQAANAGDGNATNTGGPTVQNPPGQNPPGQNAPVGHVGTVIGSTTQAVKSSTDFTSPDNNASTLIHLANGNFVAYETACTHEGVPVKYTPATNTLDCPAHGAVFNATTGAVMQGPARSPLAKVAIRVNNDGTITV